MRFPLAPQARARASTDLRGPLVAPKPGTGPAAQRPVRLPIAHLAPHPRRGQAGRPATAGLGQQRATQCRVPVRAGVGDHAPDDQARPDSALDRPELEDVLAAGVDRCNGLAERRVQRGAGAAESSGGDPVTGPARPRGPSPAQSQRTCPSICTQADRQPTNAAAVTPARGPRRLRTHRSESVRTSIPTRCVESAAGKGARPHGQGPLGRGGQVIPHSEPGSESRRATALHLTPMASASALRTAERRSPSPETCSHCSLRPSWLALAPCILRPRVQPSSRPKRPRRVAREAADSVTLCIPCSASSLGGQGPGPEPLRTCASR